MSAYTKYAIKHSLKNKLIIVESDIDLEKEILLFNSSEEARLHMDYILKIWWNIEGVYQKTLFGPYLNECSYVCVSNRTAIYDSSFIEWLTNRILYKR